jgi:hypothetical protein
MLGARQREIKKPYSQKPFLAVFLQTVAGAMHVVRCPSFISRHFR